MKFTFLKRVSGVTLIGAAVASLLSACISSDVGGEACDFGTGIPPAENESLAASAAVVLQVSKDFPSAEEAIAQSEELRQIFPSKESQAPFQFSLVLADGSPRAFYKNWVYIEGEKLETETDLQQKSTRAQGSLKRAYSCLFDTAKPFGELRKDVDLIAALGVAASSLSSAGDRHIYVFSNGLQTAGTPNMSDIFPESMAEVDEIIDKLERAKALPNLDGVKVSWNGLGQQTVGQQKLEQQSLNVLKYFWQQVILRSGGVPPEEFELGAYGTASVENAPFSAAIAEVAKICLFTVGEKSGFAFKPDSKEFLNYDLALAGAEAIAADIYEAGCGTEELRVTGFTASGTSKEAFESAGPDLKLSKARAQAFADLLIASGVNVKEVVGGGKGPIVDWDAKGNFVEELGKQNRIVQIEAAN
jgi:outer membrane protein OmpA-like peptidoglycan-associated protein